MKLEELKKLIKDSDNGEIKIKDLLTDVDYIVLSVELDVHGDLLIKIV